MNKLRYIKMALLATVSCMYQPGASGEDSAGSQSNVNHQAPVPTAKTSTSAKNPFRLTRLPVYLVGIATGAAVGMPVSLVRRCIWEEKQGIQGLVGDSKNKVAIVSAGAFWLPFSAFLGAAEAPVMGPVNSLRNYDKPFSKEQFSLGTIGEGGSRDPG